MIYFPESTALLQFNFTAEEWAPVTKTDAFFPSSYSTTSQGMPTVYLSLRAGKPAILVIAQAVKSHLIWFEGADCPCLS